MAEPKTTKNSASVPAYLAGIADPARRADCQRLAGMMRAATGSAPACGGRRSSDLAHIATNTRAGARGRGR